MMNFWEAQRRARRITTLYIVAFVLLALSVAYVSEYIMRALAPDFYHPPIPIIGLGFLILAFLVAGYHLFMFKSQGGKFVAESLGAKRIDPSSTHPVERKLINIVEEMAVAAAMPLPAIYVLPAQEINAFAAGLLPEDAVVTVTTGAIEKLSRDELQGVIAHEIGHIANADMRIGIQVAALVLGFYVIFMFGLRTLQLSRFRRGAGGRRLDPLLLASLILLIGGLISWFAGFLLQCAISRQREYLADASAVQFTRSTDGIVNALKKLEKETKKTDMPLAGMPYSHLYFDYRTAFATHPSLEKRISALLNQTFRFNDDSVSPE